MRTRPRCACCDRPLRYATQTVRAPQQSQFGYWPAKDWRYQGNQRVVSRRYAYLLVSPDGTQAIRHDNAAGKRWDGSPDPHYAEWQPERRLEEVSVWDGERYHFDWWPFCTAKCTGRYAEAAYQAGYRLTHTRAPQEAAQPGEQEVAS